MKTIFTIVFLSVLAFGASAQFPAEFESAKDKTWEVFGNVNLDAENFKYVANPDKTGINPSDSAMQFTVNATAETWAGAWSENYAPMEFTETAHTLTMMVNKSIISNCALKLEGTGLDALTVWVANSVVDEWQMLSFDFTAAIGKSYTRLVVFPDFPDVRTSGTVVLFDNINMGVPTSIRNSSNAKISVFPNPVSDLMLVQYPDMTGITITDLLGKTVRTIKFQQTGSKSMELSDLSKGVYFVSVHAGAVTHITKFIKK